MSQSELAVIGKAKDLCSYVLTITSKSPKRFRFTLTSRLQNHALDVVERLFCANEVLLSPADGTAASERLRLQRAAMTSLKLLAYLSELAMQQGCILPKQYERITRQAYDVRNMLGAWMRSDRRRLEAKGANPRPR